MLNYQRVSHRTHFHPVLIIHLEQVGPRPPGNFRTPLLWPWEWLRCRAPPSHWPSLKMQSAVRTRSNDLTLGPIGYSRKKKFREMELSRNIKKYNQVLLHFGMNIYIYVCVCILMLGPTCMVSNVALKHCATNQANHVEMAKYLNYIYIYTYIICILV
jgi:hypothetical protein